MSSSPKPPTPVDPTAVIRAQEQANRIDRVTPFGSQTYNGNTLTTTLPQGTQNAYNNISDMAGNKQQLLSRPEGYSSLQDSFMQKLNGQNQPQKSGSQPMPAPIQLLNGQQVNPAWNAALSTIWGGNNAQGGH